MHNQQNDTSTNFCFVYLKKSQSSANNRTNVVDMSTSYAPKYSYYLKYNYEQAFSQICSIPVSAVGFCSEFGHFGIK